LNSEFKASLGKARGKQGRKEGKKVERRKGTNK
jgi:hypothetical protein